MSCLRPRIVILDDDPISLQALQLALGSHFDVSLHENVESATKDIAESHPSIAILDLHLRHGSALPVLQTWRMRFPNLETLVCSGETNVQMAIDCIRQGASDYVVKPFQINDLLLVIQRTMEKVRLKANLEKLQPLILPRPIQCIASSRPMKDVLEKVGLLKGQGHLNVLIIGESGTGKEIIARLLHQQENIPDRPFVIANMPAIPGSLMESELFGVEKGAFTDAKTARAGKFELADGGDIFLDEIGDLQFETQAKLLRVLQERQFERVGSTRSRKIQFRAISATNQPLAQLISEGRFREDLVYRLSDIVLKLPPLRHHKDDIPQLVEHFLEKYTAGGTVPSLSQTALETLTQYDWPGNIRQLESTIKRALIFNRGAVIDKIDLVDLSQMGPTRSAQNPDFASRVNQFERSVIESAIVKHGGNKVLAMEELKLSKATFYRKLQAFSVPS